MLHPFRYVYPEEFHASLDGECHVLCQYQAEVAQRPVLFAEDGVFVIKLVELLREVVHLVAYQRYIVLRTGLRDDGTELGEQLHQAFFLFR